MSSTPSRGASAGPWSVTSKRQRPGPRRSPAHAQAESVPRGARGGDGACAGRWGACASARRRGGLWPGARAGARDGKGPGGGPPAVRRRRRAVGSGAGGVVPSRGPRVTLRFRVFNTAAPSHSGPERGRQREAPAALPARDVYTARTDESAANLLFPSASERIKTTATSGTQPWLETTQRCACSAGARLHEAGSGTPISPRAGQQVETPSP